VLVADVNTALYDHKLPFKSSVCMLSRPHLDSVRRKQRSLALYTGNDYMCFTPELCYHHSACMLSYKPCLVHSCNRVTKRSSAHARCKVQMGKATERVHATKIAMHHH
jgi:hypothetical protein